MNRAYHAAGALSGPFLWMLTLTIGITNSGRLELELELDLGSPSRSGSRPRLFEVEVPEEDGPDAGGGAAVPVGVDGARHDLVGRGVAQEAGRLGDHGIRVGPDQA